MPIGIMGRKSLALIALGFAVYTNKKREGINTFVYAVSLYVAETPKALIKDHEAITHNNFRHCRVRFCWTTFLETAVYLTTVSRSLKPTKVPRRQEDQ